MLKLLWSVKVIDLGKGWLCLNCLIFGCVTFSVLCSFLSPPSGGGALIWGEARPWIPWAALSSPIPSTSGRSTGLCSACTICVPGTNSKHQVRTGRKCCLPSLWAKRLHGSEDCWMRKGGKRQSSVHTRATHPYGGAAALATGALTIVTAWGNPGKCWWLSVEEQLQIDSPAPLQACCWD